LSTQLLIGDYNAKISDLIDFLIPNENLLEILDIADDDELLKEFYDYENLLRCGTPLQRYTQDKSRPNKLVLRNHSNQMTPFQSQYLLCLP
jgi:hypothetical protein